MPDPNRRGIAVSVALATASLASKPCKAALPTASLTSQPSEVYVIESNEVHQLSGGWEQRLVENDAVIIGEHHDSEADHQLEKLIIERLSASSKSRPFAVGMEMVQCGFQQVLDDFTAGRINDAELFKGTEWETRWIWSFDKYLPIFRYCKDHGLRVLALNTDSEALAKVERSGLEGLSSEDRKRLIPDSRGFGNMGKDEGFKNYLGKIVVPSYLMHEQMGILKMTVTGQTLAENMPMTHFIGGRILWDETMATNAVRYLASEEGRGGLVCVLAGADHAKYQYGVKARMERLGSSEFGNRAGRGSGLKVASVILNPSINDVVLEAGPIMARSPTGEEVRVPFADYIFVS